MTACSNRGCQIGRYSVMNFRLARIYDDVLDTARTLLFAVLMGILGTWLIRQYRYRAGIGS